MIAMNPYRFFLCGCILMTGVMSLMSCHNSPTEGGPAEQYVTAEGLLVPKDDPAAVEKALPFADGSISETMVDDHGQQCIRIAPDKSISFPDLVTERENCFIVMSKKDYYLYVYQPHDGDTTLVARYDCCFAQRKGQKEREGDMRTPHCTFDQPFQITQVADASTWEHDFGDGRGPIRSYGDYFLRLQTPGHKGIGIHGSTNNAESVPGRASEGCIRLKDSDIIDLAEQYASVGMKVVIKDEDTDDLPFEIHAMNRQHIERLRHLDPQSSQILKP